MAKLVSPRVRLRAAINKQPRYNAETEAAIREANEMLASGNYKAYSSYAELQAELLAEMEAEKFG